MYKINRDKTVLEALVFFVWCVLFYLIVDAVNDVQVTNTSNAAIYNAFLDKEWPGCVH